MKRNSGGLSTDVSEVMSTNFARVPPFRLPVELCPLRGLCHLQVWEDCPLLHLRMFHILSSSCSSSSSSFCTSSRSRSRRSYWRWQQQKLWRSARRRFHSDTIPHFSSADPSPLLQTQVGSEKRRCNKLSYLLFNLERWMWWTIPQQLTWE